MSKLIVEMEMPTVCDECPMMYDGIVCAATGTEVYPNRQARILKNGRVFDPCENRLDDCPIKGVLPDEHGDLIDRDVAFDYINRLICNGCNAETEADCEACIKKGIDDVLYFIKPTITAERRNA